jgi:serine protease DegS
MARSRLLRFIVRYALVGIVVAAGVIWLAPGLIQPERPVVQIQQAADNGESGDPVAARSLGSGPVSYADAVARAAPGVVNVYTTKQVAEPRHPFFNDPLFRRFFGGPDGEPRTRTETSLGSGVLFSDRGYVLTNNHVVEGATEIQVLLADGRSAEATVVGTDPETDLAVLQIGLQNLPTVTLGESAGLRVGDVVLAIGNPFGVGQTVTQGIVSATGRSQLGLTTFENFIQTDAAINPGNSGGALINARGELVGINTAIYSRSGGSMGIGFAIPVDLAQGVLRSIIENGRVIRGWIGVQVQQVTPQLAESFGLEEARGAVIAGIVKGAPADRAGLQPGDVVLTVDGKPVEEVMDLLRLITERKPGATITVGGTSNGETFRKEVEIDERPPQQSASAFPGQEQRP